MTVSPLSRIECQQHDICLSKTVFSKPAGKPKKEYQNKFTMLLRLRMFTSHLLLAQMVLKDFLTISEVQSLRLSISERSEPMDVQICSLLEDLIREQTLQENELEKSSSAPKTQLPKLQISNLQKLINDFVDDLKSPSEEPDKTKCIKCHRSPTSVHLTSCRHIYCQDCAGEAMIRIGSVCDCGAPVEQTVYWDSLESLIASATLRSEGNPIAMMNPRKKSRRKVTRKGSNVEVEGQKETGINWVDYAGHLMPGAKLIAISSCLEGWFKRSSQTKVVIFTQFLEMAHILNSMCQKKDWGCLLVSFNILLLLLICIYFSATDWFRRSTLAKHRFEYESRASGHFLKTQQSAFLSALTEPGGLDLTLLLQTNASW